MTRGENLPDGALLRELAERSQALREAVTRARDRDGPEGALSRLAERVAPTTAAGDSSEFADLFAQLVCYGLFAARWSDPAPAPEFTRQRARSVLPMIGSPLDEVLDFALAPVDAGTACGVYRCIDQCIQRLSETRPVSAPARSWHDPVIHAYEPYLAAYDALRRRRRGAYFTPLPVVRQIVRGVHDLLVSDLGLEDGLAATLSRGEFFARAGATAAVERPSAPFVQILDPATGTGSFLFECVRVIAELRARRWREAGERDPLRQQTRWRDYVRDSLLPRLTGFEFMPAASALARLRLALMLRQTGYELSPRDQLQVFTTNSLEPPTPDSAREVDARKLAGRFSVVIGNPPYANFDSRARTKNEEIMALLADYKRGLGERKHNLDDEFVKFVRRSQRWIERAGAGALGLVTNNSFLDGLTHRQMRASLRGSFDRIMLINLHGDARRPAAEGRTRDENVFSIRQGVAITLASRRAGAGPRAAAVATRELVGRRAHKLAALDRLRLRDDGWDALGPCAPFQFFTRRAFPNAQEYRRYTGLKELFVRSGNGVKTERDRVSIQFTRAAIERVVHDFRSREELELRARYELPRDSRDWKLARAQADVRARREPACFRELLYRPFDLRHTWYSGQTRGFIGTPAWPTMRHMLAGDNLALVTTRQTADPFGVFVTRALVGHKSVARYDINTAFPLYLDEDREGDDATRSGRRVSNLRPEFAAGLLRAVGRAPVDTTPLAVFRYVYALLHSSAYRERFAALLRVEFPRVPWPRSPSLYTALTRLGARLIALHLQEDADERAGATTPAPVGLRGSEPAPVERVRYDAPRATIWINRAATRGVAPITAAQWEARVGGYQVLRRWLRDRGGGRGRPPEPLGGAALARFCAIAASLAADQRARRHVDEAIAAAGAWPQVFAGRP